MEHGVLAGPYLERKWFRWLRLGIVTAALGAGTAMFLGAALPADGPVMPLMVLGAFWAVLGLIGLRAHRHLVREVRLDGQTVTFVSPRRTLSIPLNEITEVRRSQGDINRGMPLKVVTSSQGTLKLSPQMKGLIELLVELRAANPELRVDRA